MYQTCYWVQRYDSVSKSAYTIVDDEFEEVITDVDDHEKYGIDYFYRMTITTSIIDVYSKRGASMEKIAKCLYKAFYGVETGSSGNYTFSYMMNLAEDVEPRFKDYKEHIKLLLLFS